MAVHEMRNSLAYEEAVKSSCDDQSVDDQVDSILKQVDYQYDTVALGVFDTHKVPRVALTSSQLRKEIVRLFGKSKNKLNIRRVCSDGCAWGWFEKIGNDKYTLSLNPIVYSAEHKTLLFDLELYNEKYAAQIEEAKQIEKENEEL